MKKKEGARLDLLEVLKSKPSGEELYHNIQKIKQIAEPILAQIIRTFPEYTPHDIRHKNRVYERLNTIIPDSLKDQLNKSEIYFLIASTYLHDIGMVNFPELLDEESKKMDGQVLADYVREHHHTRVEKFVKENFRDLGLEDQHQARIVGRICRGHRLENLRDRMLFPIDTYKSDSINTPLLAGFLRIADELELTFERIPMVIYEHVTPANPISRSEWEKQDDVSGVRVSKDGLTILCKAVCKNANIHRALRKIELKISNELGELPDYLYDYQDYGRELPRRFLLEIEAVNYKEFDLKFSLQEREITQLLMGTKLYKRKEESIRELLKNAMDACKRKLSIYEKKTKAYKPEITFELSPDGKQLIVSDNGVGMDEYVLERYFAKLGQSFYQSSEFKEEEHLFTPVSELGIGILSCFMISDRLVVETKTDKSEALSVLIEDISNYFIISSGNREETGTSIRLILKENIKIDLLSEMKLYARHLEIPINVIVAGEKSQIIDEGYKATPEAFVTGRIRSENISFVDIHLDESSVHGLVSVAGMKDDESGWRATKWPYRYGDDKKNQPPKSFVSNEGIFVTNEMFRIPWIQERAVYADLNLRNRVLDLNAGTNEIVEDERLDAFIKNVERMILTRLREKLDEVRKKAIKNKVEPRKYLNGFLNDCINWSQLERISKGEQYSYYMDSENIKEYEKRYVISKEFIDFMKGIVYLKVATKNGVEYPNYSSIMSQGKRAVLVRGVYDFSDAYVEKFIKTCIGFNENDIYVIKQGNDFLYELLFPASQNVSLMAYLKMKYFKELRPILPKRYKVVQYTNYKSKWMIEYYFSNVVYLNYDHKFVNLLVRGKELLKDEKKVIVHAFFKSLQGDIKKKFEDVKSHQRLILGWFVDKGLIERAEIEDYVLSESDFPTHFFRDEWNWNLPE